jgi:hypothetical protein
MFGIIPYYPCCDEHVSVTEMTGVNDESIDEMEVSKTIEPEAHGAFPCARFCRKRLQGRATCVCPHIISV